jgi:hypothetical protein
VRKTVGGALRFRPVQCGQQSWSGSSWVAVLSPAHHHLHLSWYAKMCGGFWSGCLVAPVVDSSTCVLYKWRTRPTFHGRQLTKEDNTKGLVE